MIGKLVRGKNARQTEHFGLMRGKKLIQGELYRRGHKEGQAYQDGYEVSVFCVVRLVPFVNNNAL